MEYLVSWLVIASVQLAATMSPGPAFVVSVRNALSYGRKIGLFTALGLGLGVAAHVVFVIFGISVLIAKSVWLFEVIRYAGAAYLFYIGIKAIYGSFSKKSEGDMPKIENVDGIAQSKKGISVRKAVLTGFLTNLLNPKAVVFFTAVYTQFIDPVTPLTVLSLYGVTSVMLEFLWFCGLALVLTHCSVRDVFMRFISKIECLCGGLMVGLGLKLALSK